MEIGNLYLFSIFRISGMLFILWYNLPNQLGEHMLCKLYCIIFKLIGNRGLYC